MKYELAQQLKDAGFPQEQRRGDLLCECEGYWEKHQAHKDNPPEAYAPTLSEFIEACGEGFYSLFHDNGWWATEKNFFGGDRSDAKVGNGATPEVAVAKLWLALHTSTSTEKVGNLK
jgi:hypothetical protein